MGSKLNPLRFLKIFSLIPKSKHVTLYFVWFFLKVGLLLFVFLWVRATLPRFRYDQSSGVATFLGTTGTNVNGQSRSVGSSSGAFNAGGSSLLGSSTNPEYRTSGQLVPTSIIEAGRLEGLASRIGIPYPVLLAIRSVESGGNSSAIRFEPHIFLSERYDFGRPDLASVIPYNPGGNDAAPSVDYTSANTGLEALRNAMEHDAVAAVQSTSWGSFQVMGFNFSSGAPSEIIIKIFLSSFLFLILL